MNFSSEIAKMPESPLVSVICLCHNHARYVAKAIQSVWDQDYVAIELIVVDDASSDSSQSAIENTLKGTNTKFIVLKENIGNCKAFNLGFKASTGSFIIDLSADDVLLSRRISQGIKSFVNADIGVNFCDTFIIGPNGEAFGTHYERDSAGKMIVPVPQGDIYIHLVSKYFISPPSMMMRREVLDELGGYDENLKYEDFDFWVRSSRRWKYSFLDQVLVKKRIIKGSHSSKQFYFLSRYQKSTLEVCRKIKHMNWSEEEDTALKNRCWYEIRQCLKQGNLRLIPRFLMLIYH